MRESARQSRKKKAEGQTVTDHKLMDALSKHRNPKGNFAAILASRPQPCLDLYQVNPIKTQDETS